MAAGVQDLTRHLNGQRGDDALALDDHVYDELRRIVAAQLKSEKGGLTGRGTDMNVTKVCHDVWLKLQSTSEWHSRRHYFGSAARAARQVLVDAARKAKLGHTGQLGYGADEIADQLSGDLMDWIDAMDRFIRACEAVRPDQGRAVELRVFGGLGTDRIAEILDLSQRTVQRYLKNAAIEWRRLYGEDAPWGDGQ
ncbi:MAG: ECF-type sigma factor [Phycisphaerales bacterium JB060]